MVKSVTLSKCSIELLILLYSSRADSEVEIYKLQENHRIGRADLVVWLNKPMESSKKSRFLLESLCASLLQDLHDSFLDTDPDHDKLEKKPAGLLFFLLAAAGTLLAICEGFDGIASILSLFTAVPTLAVFIAGIVFSALSVVVFYGFDLIEISKNLGVSLGRSRELLDVFLEQTAYINNLRKEIDDCYPEISDLAERQELREMVNMLVSRSNALDEARKKYAMELNNPYLKAAKLVTASVAGVLFFGGGFFAGESLALAIAGLFVVPALVPLWLVFVASTTVGLSAFSIYWCVERPGLENLVGRWMALDKDKIDAFAGDDVVTKQKQDLHILEKKVARVDQLYKKASGLTLFDKITSQVLVRPDFNACNKSESKVNSKSHPFFKERSRSTGDLESFEQAISTALDFTQIQHSVPSLA